METYKAAIFLHCFEVSLAVLSMLLIQQTYRTKETPYMHYQKYQQVERLLKKYIPLIKDPTCFGGTPSSEIT
jgi:hypothetical protein